MDALLVFTITEAEIKKIEFLKRQLPIAIQL